jgi:hypothetical protein
MDMMNTTFSLENVEKVLAEWELDLSYANSYFVKRPEYMIESLKVHGPIKGLLLGIYRILRCHPFGKSGYDPVPAKNCWTNKLGDTANE